MCPEVAGELDDNRLVDGVTGEKLIYRKRMEPDVPLGHQQKRPKRLSFVVDVSASMSRFNGEDGRLDRMVQALVLGTGITTPPTKIWVHA